MNEPSECPSFATLGSTICVRINFTYECFRSGVGRHFLAHEDKLDGRPLAMGPMKRSEIDGLLLNYDEYAIYDRSRVRIKYLVKAQRVRTSAAGP